MGNACGAGGSQAQADAREAKAARAENTLKHRGSSMIDDQGVLKKAVTEDYEIGRVLGEGAFGKVHAGLKRTEKLKTGGDGKPDECCERAVKFLGVAALRASVLDKEINTMRRVSHHHNIVKLYECYLHGDHFVMTLEMCLGGELFDRIVAKSKYTEREARTAFAQMVEAIGHCHAHEIVHRDLKPENLLYANKEGLPGGDVLKLADFGLADIIHPDEHLRAVCGSPGYLAPEILQRTAYGKEVDLWSCGVILYILLCGYPPFWDAHGRDREVQKQIKKGQYEFDAPAWTNVSPGAKQLVSALMVVDPAKRLTAEGVFGNEDHKHCLSTEGAPEWMKSEHAALDFHIPHFCDNLHQYVLRKKLKGAVESVMAIGRLQKNLSDSGKGKGGGREASGAGKLFAKLPSDKRDGASGSTTSA